MKATKIVLAPTVIAPPDHRSLAERRIEEALEHFGYPATIFERRRWYEGKVLKTQFARRGVDAKRRQDVMAHVRNGKAGRPLSYPEIGAACGCPHTTVLGACQRFTRTQGEGP